MVTSDNQTYVPFSKQLFMHIHNTIRSHRMQKRNVRIAPIPTSPFYVNELSGYSAFGASSATGACAASAFSAFLLRLRRVDLAFFDLASLSIFSL